MHIRIDLFPEQILPIHERPIPHPWTNSSLSQVWIRQAGKDSCGQCRAPEYHDKVFASQSYPSLRQESCEFVCKVSLNRGPAEPRLLGEEKGTQLIFQQRPP